MKKFHFLLLLFFSSSSVFFAQGIVRGKITDDKGEALVGVTVSLKTNKTTGVFTDFDGNYSLKLPDSLHQILVVSYISYSTLEETIESLKSNDVLIKNFTLYSAETSLQEVEVVAKQVKANEYFMENMKKNSATTIDYISAETMKKTGDPNVTSAVARVSGVSTSGGLITVRGMGDRYVKTTFNGSIIPTLDPLTNNIKLDMFPASLVDNIIFTKTASPDLRGDWSGAYISVETKDYPEKLTVNVETQLGYNEQSSFKDVISSSRSSTDWLGYDDGLREKKQKHSEFHHPTLDNAGNSTLTSYDEMVALGLGNYYSSLGVTGFNSYDNTPYFKLGLVQLGILAPALINDPVAVTNATYVYNTTYKKQAFNKLNPDGADYNNGFANNWNTKIRRAPLNFSQSFGIGNQTTLFGKPLGYVFGFRYGSSTRYDPNGNSNRLRLNKDAIEYTNNDHVEISRENNGWSALFNVAYKLNNNNTVSFLLMPNLTGTNDVAKYQSLVLDNQQRNINKNQFYEQRKQVIYQVKSEHFIAGPKIKIDFNASYTRSKSSVPDFKVINYKIEEDDNSNIVGYQFSPTAGDGITRYYRYLSENLLDARLSAELPISKANKAGIRKLKFGAAYEENSRKSETYGYLVNQGNNKAEPLSNDDLDAYLNSNRFIMNNGKVDFLYAPSLDDNTFNMGLSIIKSAFALVDYSIIPAIRISGGLRVEKTNMFTNVYKYYDELQYSKNDLRKERDSGDINELNYLPSVNLIYKLLDNRIAQVNTRFNYSQTIARPNIREKSNYSMFDNEFRNRFIGNPDLKIAHIKNYDFRLESYFKNGDNVSVSVFYKQIKNNIEMAFGGGGGITWINVDTTVVKGIEFEGKKGITKYLELRTNVTLVKSNTKYTTNYGRFDRAMFGQAPYIVNAMLVFKGDSLGLNATVSYNIQGPKLVIVDLLPQNPVVYELPRHTIDIKISKTLGKHFSASFTIRDLLNAPVRREYRQQNGEKLNTELKDLNYDKFRYGTNYILGIVYKL